MARRYVKMNNSHIRGVVRESGETIEQKVERLVHNGEPIDDSSPRIFTERKDGVQAQYDIRADRWEIATDAMDAVQKSEKAKRGAKYKKITKDDIVKEDNKTEDLDTEMKGDVKEG